jgi:hypothetical protein
VLPRDGKPTKWMARADSIVVGPRALVCTRLADGSDGVTVMCMSDTLNEFRLDGTLVGESGYRSHIVMGVDHGGRPLTVLMSAGCNPAALIAPAQRYNVHRHRRPGGYGWGDNPAFFDTLTGGWPDSSLWGVAASENRVFVRFAGSIIAYANDDGESEKFQWPEPAWSEPSEEFDARPVAHNQHELRPAPGCNMVCDGDGNVLVPLYMPGSIAVLSPQLKLERVITLQGAPQDPPSALAIDANGHLYAVYGKNTVHEYY